MKKTLIVASSLLVATPVAASIATAEEGSFYNRPSLFSTRPSEDKSNKSIDRFGPVGISTITGSAGTVRSSATRRLWAVGT